MKSIIQDKKECFFTGCTIGLHKHHIFFGSLNRKNSEKYGLWIWLLSDWHNLGKHSVHNNPNGELDLVCKRAGQNAFEETHTREEFIKIFGKNYLD